MCAQQLLQTKKVMARITRNRQDPATKVQTKTTRSSATFSAIVEKPVKEISSKAKPSSKEALIQDENAVVTKKGKTKVRTNIKNALVQNENAVPTIKGKTGNAKSSIKKGRFQDENAGPIIDKNKANAKSSQTKTSVLGSKLQSTRKKNSSGRRSSILTLKSPVLRDRTNTSNNDTSVKKDVQLIENKKGTRTNIVKKSLKNNNKNEGELQESIKKYIAKQPIIQNKEIIQENIINTKNSVSNVSGNKNQDQVGSVSSAESNTVKTRNKSNLSIEAVEELLNQEDKETKNELNKDNSEENVPMELGDADIEDKKKEDKVTTKKFFKNKIEIKIIPTNLVNRKNPKRRATGRNKVTVVKKVINRDSTFSPKMKEQRKSTKPVQKKLRTRADKNYCEVSKVSQDSKSEKKETIEKAPASKDDKNGVPIYKTIELSQESKKDKKEIYEFPDDSQESRQKVKKQKQKRIVKKPTVKRSRKAALPGSATQKSKKKPLGKVPNKVQFKDQEEQPRKDPQQDNKHNGYANIEIPEDLQNAGESTIAEASTIKVISDKMLERSERINLMMTPSAPKTINSELKLFGPTNAITSQPKVQYSNMVNHSLIRHSMSPIIKEIDNFDVGSPWRPIDAFSRVKKVVQSTPQINRMLAGREKKPLLQMNLNKKSISSEDTIHLSSIANEKLTKQNEGDESPIQRENLSPRKFGTVISNINSTESTTTPSMKQTSLENKVQSPLKAVLPPTSIEKESEVQDNITPISTTLNKTENSILSPNKSPKKKIQTPSPFRFDRLRTSKKLVATGFKANTQDVQKENKNPNAVAGPSDSEKSKAVILRQSNLNNFLNLDEMPESSRISTPHGIFDDIHSTPINGKKPQKIDEPNIEPNIENAFGFDEDDCSEEISNIEQTSGPLIATAKDVAKSVKGKLFPNARVKSRRISENIAKKTLLQNVMKKSISEPKGPENKGNSEKNDENKENDKSLKDLENNNEPLDPKKSLLEAVSFSDTFDVLSENGEDLSSKVPDEIPLFVDLEPVHFKQPPRRSYNKRKKAVCFNTSRDDSENEEDDDYEKPKKKRKKESRLSKEEQKRLQDWVKNINESFKEIDHFDLVVE